MAFFEFLSNNWQIIILTIAALAVIGYAVYIFLSMPTTQQIAKVKEWLLYAVTEAEKELGSGTGQIKLRYVYDMFIKQFPFLVEKITFDAFSVLVDEVLEKFRMLLDQNTNIKTYVES